MLQKVRDNLRGTFVAVVVFLLFIVPLVLTGVGDGSYLGSAVGSDAASVEGKAISRADLRRAIFMRKQSLLGQQGVDPEAEFLKDENLRGPVLDNLVRRAAIIAAAQKGGMGVSEATIDKQILQQPEFHVDGKFDPQTYRRLLNNLAYTPASYKAILSEDLLLEQHARGIELSSFSTTAELSNMVALIQQKRSFYTIEIPKKLVEENVTVSDEEVALYYEENKHSFTEEEKMSVEYIELSVGAIAATVEIAEEDVRQQYELEISNFKTSEEYEIAHLLIEEKEGQAELVAEVVAKLDEGEDFAELVAQYSDDIGSKDAGGNLGVLTAGIFPEAFEKAVYSLEQGQVSEPVKTDAGVHFIKVTTKTVEEAPSYETRKAAIEASLRQAEAEQIFAESFDRLGELTFSAADLSEAAAALDLPVKTTPSFTRTRGSGITATASVRDAAFSEEVLASGYNSSVIEVSNSQALVLRKAAHEPERIKSLEEVKADIAATITERQINSELDSLVVSIVEKLAGGASPQTLAADAAYEFKTYERAERSASDAGFQVVRKAFSMALEEGTAFDKVIDSDGNHVVVGLTEVIKGKPEDMNEQQFSGLVAQLNIQNAGLENSIYESEVVGQADVDVY